MNRTRSLNKDLNVPVVKHATFEAFSASIEAEAVRLAACDQKTFAKTLAMPPKPNEALKRAFVRAANRLRNEMVG